MKQLNSCLRCDDTKLWLLSQTHLEYLFIGKGRGGAQVILTLGVEPDEPGVQVYPQLPWESEASLSYITLCKTIGQTSKSNTPIKENFLYQWARGQKEDVNPEEKYMRVSRRSWRKGVGVDMMKTH